MMIAYSIMTVQLQRSLSSDLTRS